MGTLDLGSWRSLAHVDLRLVFSAVALLGARPSRLDLVSMAFTLGVWSLHWEVRRILDLGLSSVCTG